MNFSIYKHKLEFQKKKKKKELNVNKYFLYQYKRWSVKILKNHNSTIRIKPLKNCIISKKRKKICVNSNINTRILKRLVSNGELPNFKKALW